jgi:hypothetical protein
LDYGATVEVGSSFDATPIFNTLKAVVGDAEKAA